MKYNSILETIGQTPVVRLAKLFADCPADIWLKLERANPGCSIKDRIALAMVEAAEKSGDLRPGAHIIEPTSGNTGIGLAMVAAVKGYKLTLVMPESMSLERRRCMKAYGAELVLTPKSEGIPGAIKKAEELLAAEPGAWQPQQFINKANPAVHRETTAEEIKNDFPDGLDYLITGVGTGGHITGCAQALKTNYKDLKVFAVEPEESHVLSGGQPSPHMIQGIGAGFVPDNLDVELLDGIVQVSGPQAIAMMHEVAKVEGILVGISSGATLAAIASKSKDFKSGEQALGFCYDSGERYFSNPELFA